MGHITAASAWQEMPVPDANKPVASNPVSNAVVFSAGERTVGVVSLDVCMISAETAERVRARVQAETGIPADHILVAATHNHSTPSVLGDSPYRTVVEDTAVALLVQAYREQRPAWMVAGMHETPGYEFDRRLWGPDGRIKMNWQHRYAPQWKPSGVVSDRMGFLGFEDEEGIPLGLIIAHPCHNNCGGPGITRDMGGMMGDLFRAHYGEHIGVAFLQAPCGNVNWIDSRTPRPFQGDQLALAIAGSWWGRARPVWQSAPRIAEAEIAVRRSVLQIEERPFQRCDYEEPPFLKGDAADREWLREHGFDRVWPVEIQCLAIGDAALVTNPAELFAEFGNQIMTQSPFRVTLPVELANDWVGYVPTAQAIADGGYEGLRRRHGSKLAVDAGNRITAESLRLLRECAQELEKRT